MRASQGAPLRIRDPGLSKAERQSPELNRCLGANQFGPSPLNYALRDVNVANSRHTPGAFSFASIAQAKAPARWAEVLAEAEFSPQGMSRLLAASIQSESDMSVK